MEFDYIIRHEKSLRVLAVKEGGPICLECLGDYVCEIDPCDVGFVAMIEPGLLKSGSITFYDNSGENILSYETEDGHSFMAFIEVSRKEKNNFYQMFTAFKNMGLEIKAF